MYLQNYPKHLEGELTPITLFLAPGVPAFAKGGLARAAQQIREAGRHGDTVLIHVNKDELRQMRDMWGAPQINPKTGLPEYGFLSKTWKKIKKGAKKLFKNKLFQTIAPIALNFLVPGLGVAIGGALGASGTTAAMLGKAVIGAGLGAASGGKKGALAGALSGGMSGGGGGALGRALGMQGNNARLLGNALLSGGVSKVQGGDFGQGALMGGVTSALNFPGMTNDDMAPPEMASLAPTTTGAQMPSAPQVPGATPPFVPDIGAIDPGPMPTLGKVAEPTIWERLQGAPAKVIDYAKEHPIQAALIAATLLQSSKSPKQPKPPQLPPGWNDPLPEYEFNRRQTMPPGDPFSYGMGPEMDFYEENQLPVPGMNYGGYVRLCEGGMHRYARGGLARAAREVTGAGRYGDDQLIHVTPEQFNQLRAVWGEPTYNPQTGMPEYFLSGLKKKLKKILPKELKNVAKFEVSNLKTMLKGAKKNPLSLALGAATPVGAKLWGGITGKKFTPLVNMYGGPTEQSFLDAEAKGIDTGLSRGSHKMAEAVASIWGGKGALSGLGKLAGAGMGALGGTGTAAAAAPKAATGALGAAGKYLTDPKVLAGGAMLVSGAMGGGGEPQSGGPAPYDPGPGEELPPLDFGGRMQNIMAPEDYYTYGAMPEPMRFNPGMSEEQEQGMYRGGYALRHGGAPYVDLGSAESGRADNIDAKLSENEYVIDAETVALLGDGNPEAGAKKLDSMRLRIRKHKGGALARGKFSPAARDPMAYLGAR